MLHALDTDTRHPAPDTRHQHMLHIHNGDSSANVAKQSSLPGEHFAWREALIEGPTPSGLDVTEWRKRRAHHLSEAYGVDPKLCERELSAQEQKLETFPKHDEVILWFEHDLFCQVHLIYLLNWFGRHQLGKTRLSLICIDEFPGKEDFRGLGELSVEQLTSLFPSRNQVTKQQVNLASAAWRAYCSKDPTDIQTLLENDISALPFLKAALKAHLRRFPSTTNGLGQIENRALQLIHSGSKRFDDLFFRFSKAEPVYGLGDSQFLLALRRLSEAGQPLLEKETGSNGGPELTEGVSHEARFRITDLGVAVLKGDADFVLLNGIDLWLGGVYLSSERNLWRWDDDLEKLVLT
jgi:hypothetical protein